MLHRINRINRDKVPLYLAYIASVIAIALMYPQIYFDRVLYVVFGENLHSFIQYCLPNWPYYIFPLIIIVSTIRKKLLYMLFVVLFLPYVFHNQVRFIIEVWTDPTVISMEHSLLISILTVIMVSLALISGMMALYRLK